MKELLKFSALVCATMALFVGCSDGPTQQTVNTYLQYKKGDTFTYARYERDTNNQRVETSKTVHKWIVVTADTSIQGKTGATVIHQINYDASGTTETGPRDTLVFRSGADGEVFQFDALASLVARIPVAAPIAGQLPKAWLQIGDVKTGGTRSWDGLRQVLVASVTFPGLPTPISVRLADTARHMGKMSVTVPAGTYQSAFHTDHALDITATEPLTQTTALNDSLEMSYVLDISGGMVKQAVKSKNVTVTIPGSGTQQQQVLGYEMELMSVTRAK